MSETEMREEYERYVARFNAAIDGDVAVGAFAKYKGKLVKKMAFDEFSATHDEYHQLAAHYITSLDRGDTINDVIVKSIRDAAATLIITPPV